MESVVDGTADALSIDRVTPQSDGPLVVGTTTLADSDAALTFAAAIGEQVTAQLVAVSVVELQTIPMYGIDGLTLSADLVQESALSREAAVRAQLDRVLVSPMPWRVVVRTGDAAREIAAAAEELHARLVVVGRGKHGAFDRLVSGESVRRLVQHGSTPVLAVAPTLTRAPRRVVIAMDFSPFSIFAAQVALTLVAPDATVWLVHVAPRADLLVPYMLQHDERSREDMVAAFAQIRRTLQRAELQIESVVREGSAAHELTEFATAQEADLVVTASHGHGFIRRMILGSVAASLIRHAPCSVLVVPGSARTVSEARATVGGGRRTRTLVRATLDAELAAFTQRNGGRRCDVEVDDATLGSQVLGHDLRFVGVTYDPHSEAVHLMFGASGSMAAHLAHTVLRVIEVDVASDASGADQVLCVRHDRGQTLLLLV